MKASELRSKSIAELREELVALRKEQFNIRMQKGSGQEVRPHQITLVRKNIAKVKTVIRELEIAGAGK